MKIIDLGELLEKIPRPDRYGLVGAVFALGILWNLLTPYLGESGDLVCQVVPWKCQRQGEEISEQRQHHYRAIPLVFGKGKGPKICACHLDIQVAGGPIQHVVWPTMPTCDSDDTDPRDWTHPRAYCEQARTEYPELKFGHCSDVFVSIWDSERSTRRTWSLGAADQYRYHCSEEWPISRSVGRFTQEQP